MGLNGTLKWIKNFLQALLPGYVFRQIEKYAKMVLRLISAVGPLLFSFLVWSGIYRLLAKIFKITAENGKGSNICLKEGFLPVPVHFYSSVPDLQDLEARKIWDFVSPMNGIDFREDWQVAFLRSLGERFGAECNWSIMPTSDPAKFFLQNTTFSYGCAASSHCVIRHYKPSTVIEIGSGMSSRVIAEALELNRIDGRPGHYCIVDPYPGDAVSSGVIPVAELVQSRVELIDPEFFSCLKENDVLFIDSSHSVKIGSDVNYIYLDLLPRLAPGVIIHIHDIGLPYEYARTYAASETFRQFWTEQYLLQGFLTFNTEFEVLLAMHYLMVDHSTLFKEVFPLYAVEVPPSVSGSFWMRRKPLE